MRLHALVSVLIFACVGLVSSRGLAAPAPATPRVAILANSSDADSVSLAHYYAKKRGLPTSAIVALPMSLSEQIGWNEFVASIWNPLLAEAVKRDWLLASLNGQDAYGRTASVCAGHKLDAIVICRGVPLRIAHDTALYDAKSNPLTANSALRTNLAAVDSELALLACGNPPIDAFFVNPLHNQEHPGSTVLDQIIPVGRLDGPSLDDAKNLVDGALVAERDGLAGRAYVDIGGPHRQGDDWLEACVPQLNALGFETDVDRAAGTMPASARFDAPALYFGWYAGHLNGPFAERDFHFPPGAVAIHIHSFSAYTLRSPTEGWTGPLVGKGVSGTVGNVAEPYLQFTHQPQLFLQALARGEPLGRAALYSINALSWMGVLVGDPLYRPFAVSAEEQWARRKELPPGTETYARIRRMRLLAAADKRDEALALGIAGLAQNPSLALALTLADLQQTGGDKAAARRTLGVFAGTRKFRPADRPLALAAARACEAAADFDAGYKIAKRLLADDSLPKDFRIVALLTGADLARASGHPGQASSWAAEHALLTAPPPARAKS